MATFLVLLLVVATYLACWVFEFVKISLDTTVDPSSGISPSEWGTEWQLIESALDALGTACMVAPLVAVISLILFWNRMRRT